MVDKPFDIRECPKCGHKIDVTGWRVMEAYGCENENCDALLFVDIDEVLRETDASGVTF